MGKKEFWPKEVTEVKPVTEYTTSDGKKFPKKEDAVNHENELRKDRRRELIRLHICGVLGLPTKFEAVHDEDGGLVMDAEEAEDDAVNDVIESCDQRSWVTYDVDGMDELISAVEDILKELDGKLLEILIRSKDLIIR